MRGTDGRRMSYDLRSRSTRKYADSSCSVPLASVELLPIESLEPAFRSPALGTLRDVGAKAKRAGHVPGWLSLGFAALDELRTRDPFASARTS